MSLGSMGKKTTTAVGNLARLSGYDFRCRRSPWGSYHWGRGCTQHRLSDLTRVSKSQRMRGKLPPGVLHDESSRKFAPRAYTTGYQKPNCPRASGFYLMIHRSTRTSSRSGQDGSFPSFADVFTKTKYAAGIFSSIPLRTADTTSPQQRYNNARTALYVRVTSCVFVRTGHSGDNAHCLAIYQGIQTTNRTCIYA